MCGRKNPKKYESRSSISRQNEDQRIIDSAKMREAVNDIMVNNINVNEAVDKYGVKKRTLEKKLSIVKGDIKKIDEINIEKSGVGNVLDEQEELIIIDRLTISGHLRQPMTKQELSQWIAVWGITNHCNDTKCHIPKEWMKNQRTSRKYIRQFITKYHYLIHVKRGKSLAHHRHIFTTEVCIAQ